MIEFSKKFVCCSLMVISVTSFINISVLYWFPIQTPLSIYSIVSLMLTGLFLKIYYLIPVSFLSCIFIFLTALSLRKKRIVCPVFSLVFLLCDLFVLAFSFFDAWFNDDVFIVIQAMQIVVGVTVIVFLCIYCFLFFKNKAIRGKG